MFNISDQKGHWIHYICIYPHWSQKSKIEIKIKKNLFQWEIQLVKMMNLFIIDFATTILISNSGSAELDTLQGELET